jgi:hypothetical protein
MMQFLFILLRIKGIYMFQALLAHPQEVLYKRNLVLTSANVKRLFIILTLLLILLHVTDFVTSHIYIRIYLVLSTT